jgi:ankyrin repeat protein
MTFENALRAAEKLAEDRGVKLGECLFSIPLGDDGWAFNFGSGTGLNAFHWAVNRGQLEAVRLLLKWKASLDVRSMYGGNVLDTAIWPATSRDRASEKLSKSC